MDECEQLILLAELDREHCHLNHGPKINSATIKAVDYLTIPIGYKESADCEVATKEMVIPVCRECITALQEEEWTLLYCLECCENRWVYRQMAKNNYRHHILWLKGCPECTGKFGGLYFNDQPIVGESQ